MPRMTVAKGIDRRRRIQRMSKWAEIPVVVALGVMLEQKDEREKGGEAQVGGKEREESNE